jgi:hypothetical protein
MPEKRWSTDREYRAVEKRNRLLYDRQKVSDVV